MPESWRPAFSQSSKLRSVGICNPTPLMRTCLRERAAPLGSTPVVATSDLTTISRLDHHETLPTREREQDNIAFQDADSPSNST